MATLRKIGVTIDTKVELVLNEHELCALDALVGYGVDNFLKCFYATMGQAYLKPYEDGLRSLFESVRGCASLKLEADECREFMRQSVKEKVSKSTGIRKATL